MSAETIITGESLSDTEMAEAAEWVVRMQSAEASEGDFAAWEDWLNDPRHNAAYAAVEEVWMLAAQVKPAPWPSREELDAQTRAENLRSGQSSRIPMTRRRKRASIAIAASLIVALISAAWLIWQASPTTLELSHCRATLRSSRRWLTGHAGRRDASGCGAAQGPARHPHGSRRSLFRGFARCEEALSSCVPMDTRRSR